MAVAIAGCKGEQTFTEPLPDLAGIHWVNAVPDTGAQDIRIVDIASNAGLYGADFRGSNMFYQPMEAGTRHVKIFVSDSSPAIAQTVLADVTQSFTKAANYTFIHTGFARSGATPAKEVVLVQDNPPTPGTGQIAVRVINAGSGLGNVDVWVVKRAVNPATADSLPDTRSVSNLAYKATSGYLAVPVDAGADAMRVVVSATGTKTALASVTAPAGVAGTATTNPIPGSAISGTAFTAVVVPRSVAGSRAPAGFTTPSVVYLVDKRPPNTAP